MHVRAQPDGNHTLMSGMMSDGNAAATPTAAEGGGNQPLPTHKASQDWEIENERTSGGRVQTLRVGLRRQWGLLRQRRPYPGCGRSGGHPSCKRRCQRGG